MRPGDVVLIQLPQVAGGPRKSRPALVLALLPGIYQNVLICGISTQLQDLQPDWDERIEPGDADFPRSGLHRTSAVRLSYLYGADASEISGVIGRVDVGRLNRVRRRLAARLTEWPI
jgi:mRNA interferase MazF